MAKRTDPRVKELKQKVEELKASAPAADKSYLERGCTLAIAKMVSLRTVREILDAIRSKNRSASNPEGSTVGISEEVAALWQDSTPEEILAKLSPTGRQELQAALERIKGKSLQEIWKALTPEDRAEAMIGPPSKRSKKRRRSTA